MTPLCITANLLCTVVALEIYELDMKLQMYFITKRCSNAVNISLAELMVYKTKTNARFIPTQKISNRFTIKTEKKLHASIVQVYSGRDIYQSWAANSPKTAGATIRQQAPKLRWGNNCQQVSMKYCMAAARARKLGKNNADLQKNTGPPNKYFSTLFP